MDKYYGFNVLCFFSAGYKNPVIRPDKITIDTKDLDLMAEMGCNFVRVPTDYRYFVSGDYYENYNQEMLALLDNAIEEIVKRGMQCSLNVHRAPGYCINGNELEQHNLWIDPIAQNGFTDLWTMFAKRYKNYHKEQLSFDLLNEPPYPDTMGMTRENHKAIMSRVTKAIREVSPQREIICDGVGCGHLACPELLDLNVTVSGRGYTPVQLTHYQAEWMKDFGAMDWPYPEYPGFEAEGVKWDREQLLKFYAPWKEMADKGCKVHIGEAGVFNKVRNETALKFYEDFFSVCNELGFGYALWNFRGPFGVAEHGRFGTNWITKNGIEFDAELYELFKKHMI